MSPEWLSAYAAVGQAIMSVAAILASVRIAHKADQRAAAAEIKSLQREREAENAAVARAEAAERRAEERIRQTENARWNNIIRQAVSFAKPAHDDLVRVVRESAQLASDGDPSFIHGGWSYHEAEDARKVIARLREQAEDPELAIALKDLSDQLSPKNHGSGASRADFTVWLVGIAGNLENAIERVKRFERT